MKTRVLFLALSSVLIYSSTTEPGIPMRATSAQTETCGN